METQEVADFLMQNAYATDALHGDLSQAQRDTVMKKFRLKTLIFLVATDVASERTWCKFSYARNSLLASRWSRSFRTQKW